MKKQLLLSLFAALFVLFGSPMVGVGQITEGFESGLPTTYSTIPINYTLTSGTWVGTNIYKGTSASTPYGSVCLQIKSSAGAQATSPNIATGGVGTISFASKGSTSIGSVEVNYRINGGSWTAATGSPFSLSTAWTSYVATVNDGSANIEFQFLRTGATVYVDNVVTTAFAASTDTEVQFTSATSTRAEDGVSIDVCASITNPSASAATTVDITYTGGTATNGTDYDDGAGIPAAITFPQTLTFPIGSSTDQCFTIYINNDLLIESDETIILELSNIGGGSGTPTIGTENVHTVTITDNDAPVLSISSVSPTTFCVGNSVTAAVAVDFLVVGVIQLGNTYTAQLSDASGSFASPTDIGSVASVLSAGTINATIPDNIPAGTGYRIRVVASAPATLGGDNGTDITIETFTAPTALAASCGNTNATVDWTNPDCFDEIMVVAKASAFTSALPSGTSYTANLAFGSGTAFDGGTVVYKGTGTTSGTITNLTNGTTYYFKIYARKGSVWVAGSVESCAPAAGPCLSDDSGYLGWTLSGAISASSQACTGNGLLFTGSGEYVVSPVISNPNKLNFNYKRSGNSTTWNLKVQISTSSSGPWTDVTSIGTPTNTCSAVSEIDLSSYSGNQYLRFLDNRGSGTHERGIDDITVTCSAPVADVNVKGNSQDIADGQTATGTADHTEFAATEVGQTSTRTFTITNSGAAGTINLTNPVTVSGSVFTVTTQPTDVALDAGESTTFTVTFTPTGITTETETITLITDDPDVAEQSYTFNVSGTGTYSQLSDIVSNGGETVNIAHSAALVSNALVVGNSVQAGEFTLRDGGGAADNDNRVTTLTAISFSVLNSANLQKVALYDGTTELQEVAAAATVSFTGLSIATPTDGGSKNFSIRVTFKTAVTDNQQFQFTVTSATASATGSGFAAADAGGAFTSIAGDDNRIEVTASTMVFGTQPVNTSVSTDMAPFTLAFRDANGNLDFDGNRTVTISATTGVGMAPATPSVSITAPHTGLATFTGASAVQFGTAPQTGITVTASAAGFSAVESDPFDVTTIVYANGDYRSIGNGTWLSNTAAPAIWERFTGGTWSASNSPSYNTSNNVYIQDGTTVTTNGSFGNNIKMIINSGGTFTCNHQGTAATMLVKDGGTLTVNASFSMASGGAFEVEDNGSVFLNAAYSNPTTSIWNGVENFHPNSHLYIWDWAASEPPLIDNDVTTNTYSGYTAAFGNLYIDIAGGAVNNHWALLGDNYGTKNLCHGNIEFESANGYDIRFFTTSSTTAVAGIQGDFKMNSGWSSARTVSLTTGSANLTLNVTGDFVMDCAGDFSVRASNSGGGGATLNIEGDLLMNGVNTSTATNFKLNQNSYGTANGGLATVNLQGNLTASAASLFNSGAMADQAFNFTGTATQLVNVASIVADAGALGFPMYVKAGATVQLSTNDLEIDQGSTLTVESGGTFDFNWATNGTTPLVLKQPGFVTEDPAFTVESGGTIKITSTDGITTIGNAFGNVLTTDRTYNAGATYHYIGKANQVTGNGLPTTLTNGKLIVDMNASALTLSLTASTTVGGTGELGLVNGLLVLDDKNITIGTTATVTGTPSATNMAVTNNTGQFFKTYNSSTPFTYPVGDNVGTTEYAPVTFSLASGAGNVGVIVTDGNHPNLPVVSNYLSRYWNFTNTLGSSYSYEAIFNYVAADVVGSTASIKAARYTGTNPLWNIITGSNATGTALAITVAQTQATAALNQAFTGLESISCTPGTWTGATDNNWNVATNWCSGVVPTLATNVIIPDVTNQPIISAATPVAVCNNLTVDAGATLTINSARELTADGNVTNNGTVYVRNSGNFFQTENGNSAHAGTGNFVVERQGSSAGGFNGWSTPVVAGNLPGNNGHSYNSLSGTNGGTDDNNPNPDPGWVAHSGAMTPGKGYFSINGGAATFTGKANNGNYIAGVTSSTEALASTVAPSFFNLVGNPYPSAMSADQFIIDNSARIDGTIYFWADENLGPNAFSQSDYATYTLAGAIPTAPGGSGPTPNGSIPSCQGFFVNCISAGNVSFSNAQRAGSNGQFFRMAAPPTQKLWLSIGNDDLQLFNQTLVSFDEDATDQKDWGVDAYKFRGNAGISIGAVQDGETYAIATYSAIPQTGKTIPLLTYVQAADTYTFVADSMEGFDNHNVYLEDLSNGSLYPLTQGDAYSFAMTNADEYNRFQLWFSPLLVTDVAAQRDEFSIYATSTNMIVVETGRPEPIKGTVQILDMTGRNVFEQTINVTNGIGRIQAATVATGIYAIIFVPADGNRITSGKVVLGR